MLGETVDLCAVFQPDGDAARAAGGFGVHTADDADLALAGLAIDADDHHVAGRERPLLHVFEGVAVEKYLLPKLRQLIIVNDAGVAHIGVWHQRRKRLFIIRAGGILCIADRSGRHCLIS